MGTATMTAAEQAAQAVRDLTRWRDDFPTPGVRFADLTPVFADANGFRAITQCLASVGPEADLVAGVDARGFVVGAGVAAARGLGVLLVRKAGKLPPPVLAQRYTTEYGPDQVEIAAAGVSLPGRRVLLLDDVLATGGTLAAATRLLAAAGAQVVAVGVVLELGFLGGRQRLGEVAVTSITQV